MYTHTHTYLPHGLDALLEEVYVAVRGELTRPGQVAVVCPELLHLQGRGKGEGERGEGERGEGEGEREG